MSQEEYIIRSFELHLFFDRIMKEHSFFLEAAFMEPQMSLKETANRFKQQFSQILGEVVVLANNNVSKNLLEGNEFVTKNTKMAEIQSSNLSGIRIDTNITDQELNLRSGNVNASGDMARRISDINQRTLPLIRELISFKGNILNQVLTCRMYTTNYPLLITHIMNEAKMYNDLLSRVENRYPFDENYIYEQELFWNNIMKEHAEFIRGLLDPSEQELILTADRYADEYNKIIKNYSNNVNQLTNISFQETMKFRDFKVAGEEGILNCKIKSIIIPLLADHVLREANHFIRILSGGTKR